MFDAPSWLRHVSYVEAEKLLRTAAREHPAHFTNPEAVAAGWFKTLYRRGFVALCPYAQMAFAKACGKTREDLTMEAQIKCLDLSKTRPQSYA